MAYQCEICNKKVVTGNNVSHSNRHTRRRWMPNLQTLRIVLPNGQVKRAKVCTNCIKSGKVTKVPVRNYKKPETKTEAK